MDNQIDNSLFKKEVLDLEESDYFIEANQFKNNLLFKEAVDFEENGNFNEAKRCYEYIIYYTTYYRLAACYRLANIYIKEKNLNLAIEYYKKSIKNGGIGSYELADLYLHNNINHEEAIQLLKEETFNNKLFDILNYMINNKLHEEAFNIIYYQYNKSKQIGNQDKLLSSMPIKMKDNFLEYYLESYEKLDKNYKEYKLKYDMLKAHLEFSPDGPGYIEAEKDFLTKLQS